MILMKIEARLLARIGALAAFYVAAVQPANAQNTYNSNGFFKITSVLVYTESDQILFTVDVVPPLCGPYFVVPDSISADRRQQILSRLLTAYTTNEQINIGYDGVTCFGTSFRAFRVG